MDTREGAEVVEMCLGDREDKAISKSKSRIRRIPAKYWEESKTTRKVEKLEVKLSDWRE